ncbi:hypothetical protein F4809DRAFT_618059 [Biscogniauxia mediterranea]|nr:hypothetical protein F4809DRAFT_618059 [Biscogniauxia mediterranea]
MASTITKGPDDGTYGICGIPAPDVASKTKIIPYAPGMPVRLEVSVLAAADTDITRRQWTLFILALENFKAMPVDQKLSYFQVAGIHGFSATPWDGADPPSDLCPDDGRFYHSNPLWRFGNPEKGPDSKPRKMGEMPAGKEQCNITDNYDPDATPRKHCR